MTKKVKAVSGVPIWGDGGVERGIESTLENVQEAAMVSATLRGLQLLRQCPALHLLMFNKSVWSGWGSLSIAWRFIICHYLQHQCSWPWNQRKEWLRQQGKGDVNMTIWVAVMGPLLDDTLVSWCLSLHQSKPLWLCSALYQSLGETSEDIWGEGTEIFC